MMARSAKSRTEYVDNFVGKLTPVMPNPVFSRLGHKTTPKKADGNPMKSMSYNDVSGLAADFSEMDSSLPEGRICGYCSRKRAGKARFY
jgi:hypothetical protein